MATYDYQKANVDQGKLLAECQAAGLPVVDVQGGAVGSPDVHVVTSADLTPLQKAALDNLVATHDGRPRRPRLLAAILADVAALSAARQTAVWGDLTSGATPRWRATSSDGCVWAKASQGTTSTLEKQVAVAFYCREFPKYLVGPAFDPGINVPGDEPYTP